MLNLHCKPSIHACVTVYININNLPCKSATPLEPCLVNDRTSCEYTFDDYNYVVSCFKKEISIEKQCNTFEPWHIFITLSAFMYTTFREYNLGKNVLSCHMLSKQHVIKSSTTHLDRNKMLRE